MKIYINLLALVFCYFPCVVFASSNNGCENLVGTTWVMGGYDYTLSITGYDTDHHGNLIGFLNGKPLSNGSHRSMCGTMGNKLWSLWITDGNSLMLTRYWGQGFDDPYNPHSIDLDLYGNKYSKDPTDKKFVDYGVAIYKISS